MTSVKDIMTKSVITFDEDSFLDKIALKMRKKNAGSAIIVKDGNPIGIITERDLSQKVVAENVNPSKAVAKMVMTTPIISVKPEADIHYASKIMEEKNIKKMPVISKGKLKGIITQTDLSKHFIKQRKKFVLSKLGKDFRETYSY